MKRFRLFHITAVLGLTLALLPGCALAPTDITDLMRPPKLTGSQQAIENALEANFGNKYLLKYPLTGKYRTPFILHDIDGDGSNEAFVLYTPESDNAGTHIMVLKNSSGKWQKECDISGDGNEVSRIEFGDYDGSGRQYLTVGWTFFNSTDLGLTIYGISKGASKKLYTDTYTDMDVLDMNGDKKDDLLLLNLDTGSKTSQARMISYSSADGKLRQVAQAPLDSTVNSYAGLSESRLLNGSSGVYIDGYKGAHSMVTELVYWKDGGLVTPFYNKMTGTASSTLRDVPITCDDIDGDNYIEIPMLVELPGYEDKDYKDKIYLVRWNSFTADGTLKPKLSCIMNFSQGYFLEIPKAWEKTVTVQSTAGGKIWDFREYVKGSPFSGRLLFELATYSQSEWSSRENKNGFTKVLEDSNSVYAVRLGNKAGASDALYMSQADIAARLKLYTPQQQ